MRNGRKKPQQTDWHMYLAGLTKSERNFVDPDLIPMVSQASLFQLSCVTSALCRSQIAHGQFAGREDRQEQIGPDVEAAIGDTSWAGMVTNRSF